MEDGVHVIDGGHCISVIQVSGGLSIACASADYSEGFFGRGHWWLARLKVEPAYQGKKLGSVILELLKEKVSQKEGFGSLIVSPGGYGSDIERLVKFYESHGFMKLDEGTYSWRKDGNENHEGGGLQTA